MLMSRSSNYRGRTSIISKKKKIAQLIIARLDGNDVNKKFKYYESLVKKGIGGFIVFGGRLKEVSRAIKRLQLLAEIPLFIASDLEQGLGQQIEGGTLFPPAMALGQAIDPKSRNDIKLLKQSISIIAQEAKATGVNVIFSPVLDVNTSPENPIICTRAFSDNPEKVSWFGREFVKGFQKQGLVACAKHFPGHGDTTRDSHRELPVVEADMDRLGSVELYPFAQTIKAGVKMIMTGHLKVPALDSKLPSSLSQKVVRGLLQEKMKFYGLVITDAMNMHAVRGKNRKSEADACLLALNAGADILLHPEDPEEEINSLYSKWNEIKTAVERSFKKVIKAKKDLGKSLRSPFTINCIGSKSHRKTAHELFEKSIRVIPPLRPLLKGGLGEPVVLIIDDDNCKSGNFFVRSMRDSYPEVKTMYIDNKYKGDMKAVLNSIADKILIAAVFSKISAWKGRAGLSRKLQTILEKAASISGYSVVSGFCCPYIFSNIKADAVIEAYSDSPEAQEAAARRLCSA